jgi:hypothetical protein
MNAKRSSIVEKEKTLPVIGEYDVVVVGGGIAGVAAAVAAARNGAKTCVIEKEFGLGGLATLGNVIVYLPLCDGMGNQVIKGLGEELLKLSIKDEYSKIPDCWTNGSDKKQRSDQRFKVSFNPMSFMLELEEFVLKNNVELYYDTRFCALQKTGNFITSIIIENKSGRSAIACKSIVDATGDADVCWQAGEETVSLNSNVRASWFYYFDGDKVNLRKFTKPYDMHGKLPPGSGRGFAGDNGKDVSDFILETRKLIKRELCEIKKENRKISPLFMTSIPAMRMTRRLRGSVEINESDDKRYFDDCIGMTGDWRKKGPVFFIPFRALSAINTANLIAAGRCISVGETAWDITRVIPTCAVTGEAAGTASALLCQHENASFSELNIAELQDRLLKQNVIIDKKIDGI